MVAGSVECNNPVRWSPTEMIDIWIDAPGSYALCWEALVGHEILWSFEVTNGGGVDFFICDWDSYQMWRTGNSTNVAYVRYNVESHSGSFEIPYTDTWVFVLVNNDGFSRRHVEGSIALLYVSSTPENIPLVIASVVGVLSAIIFLVAVCVPATANRRKASRSVRPQVTTHQGSDGPLGPYALGPESQGANCPYCGAQINHMAAKYCSNCGKRLG